MIYGRSMKKIKLKRDKYKNSRGGCSRLLDLHCQKCNNLIAVYQKDGPGNLRRLYMDRIVSPERLIGFQHKDIKDIFPLRCDRCDLIVGMPYVYEKEKRKAFRVIHGAIARRLRKSHNQKNKGKKYFSLISKGGE